MSERSLIRMLIHYQEVPCKDCDTPTQWSVDNLPNTCSHCVRPEKFQFPKKGQKS